MTVPIDNGGRLRALLVQSLRTGSLAVASLLACPLALGEDLSDALDRAQAERRAGNLDVAAALLAESIAGVDTAARGRRPALLHRALGEVRFEQGRGEEAAREFERALALAPRQGVLHYQAGLAWRTAGRQPEAARHLRQAVDLGFRNTGALLHLAGAEFASGRLSGGWSAARQLLSMSPRSTSVLVQAGGLLFGQFFYSDALQAFEAALEISPDSYEARHFAALANHMLNRHETAVSLLRVFDVARSTAESASLLASSLALAGRPSEAEAVFLDVIRRWPDSPHAYLNLAFMLLDLDRVNEAESRLEALRGLPSAVRPKVFFSARRDSCPGRSDERPADRPAGFRDARRADDYFELASALASRQHHRTAAALLGLARAYEGDTPRVLEALAYSCLHVEPGNPALLPLLEALARLAPQRGRAHHLLGRAYVRQERREAGLASLRKAVGLSPRNSLFLRDLGRALAGGGELTDRLGAIKALSSAAAADDRDALSRYELGKLLSGLGRFEEAIAALEAVIEIEPELHNAYYLLGRACLRVGRRSEAERHLEMFEEKRTAAEARSTADTGFSSGS